MNAYVIMPTHLHAILFDIKFNSDRLKHTLDDMRKLTGRLLVEHAALPLPKVYKEVLKENAGKDRQHRFWQATRHPVGLLTETVWQQKMEYLHDNPCRKGLVKSPQDTCTWCRCK